MTGRILRPLAQMPTETDRVRDQVWERGRNSAARAHDRTIIRLCPDSAQKGRDTWRTGANLHKDLPAVPEGPDNRLLNEYTKPRSVKKPAMGAKARHFRGGGGHFSIRADALGES